MNCLWGRGLHPQIRQHPAVDHTESGEGQTNSPRTTSSSALALPSRVAVNGDLLLGAEIASLPRIISGSWLLMVGRQ